MDVGSMPLADDAVYRPDPGIGAAVNRHGAGRFGALGARALAWRPSQEANSYFSLAEQHERNRSFKQRWVVPADSAVVRRRFSQER
jgi:hypothetical protein